MSFGGALAYRLHYIRATEIQDWLPGVAGTEPRLSSGLLGGQFEKGGLHQPPFSFAWCVLVVGRCGSQAYRECVIEVVQFRGPIR